MATQRKWFIALAVLVALVAGFVVAYLFTPPLFVQTGNHFFVVPNLLTIGGQVWRCDPPKTEDCVPTWETWPVAIANDPNPLHWFPITIEDMSPD